jgi:hypothetical protein
VCVCVECAIDNKSVFVWLLQFCQWAQLKIWSNQLSHEPVRISDLKIIRLRNQECKSWSEKSGDEGMRCTLHGDLEREVLHGVSRAPGREKMRLEQCAVQCPITQAWRQTPNNNSNKNINNKNMYLPADVVLLKRRQAITQNVHCELQNKRRGFIFFLIIALWETIALVLFPVKFFYYVIVIGVWQNKKYIW